MKFNTKIFFIASVLMAGLTACSVESPREEVKTQPEIPVDAVPGQLLVRFDARVADVLDKAGLTRCGSSAPMTRSGVLSVDEILDLVDGYHIERVFPVDKRNEAKAREEGLHLWYVVKFDDDVPVHEVAGRLARLGEVSCVEYNRTLKKANTSKATPLTMEKVRQLAGRSVSSDFDDPLLPQQC